MSSDVPLDPCRQWLGIEAVDLGDHRRVLGVAPDERDPLAVLRAAETRLTRLRGVSAGSLEFVRAGFIKRVEAARESVLAEIATSGPREPQGASSAFRRPPAPSTLATKRPAVPIPPPVPVPLVSPPPVPRPVMPAASAAGLDNGGGLAPIAIRTTVYRKKTPVLGVTLLMLGLTALAGGLSYYVFVLKPKQAAQGVQSTAPREESQAEDEEGGATASGTTGTGQTAAVEEDADRPPPRARRRRPRSPQDAATPDERSAQTPVPVVAVPMTKPKPAPGMPEAAMREESRLLDATLVDALAALRGKQDDTVEELLKGAAGRARSPEARQRVAGWQRLAASYRRFLESREAALDSVEPGASYDVQGQKVVIETLDGEKCVYRTSGPPKTVSREKIPAGIVLAIVAKWAGDDPEGDMAIAAYQLARQDPEVRRAREQLDKAGEAGADVAAFLAIIDDPAFAPAADTK